MFHRIIQEAKVAHFLLRHGVEIWDRAQREVAQRRKSDCLSWSTTVNVVKCPFLQNPSMEVAEICRQFLPDKGLPLPL